MLEASSVWMLKSLRLKNSLKLGGNELFLLQEVKEHDPSGQRVTAECLMTFKALKNTRRT